MDFLKTRTSMSEIRQAPKYDHVVWSASYQTSGNLRRHAEYDSNILEILYEEPRVKSATAAGLRSRASLDGSSSARSVSRQSQRSERSAKSARMNRPSPLLRKGLSSPALLIQGPIQQPGLNQSLGNTEQSDGQLNGLRLGVKFDSLNKDIQKQNHASDSSSQAHSYRTSCKDTSGQTQRVPKVIPKSLLSRSKSAPEMLALRRAGAKVTRPVTPREKWRGDVNVEPDSSSSEWSSDDENDFTDKDTNSNKPDNFLAHLTWEKPSKENDARSSKRTANNSEQRDTTKHRKRSVPPYTGQGSETGRNHKYEREHTQNGHRDVNSGSSSRVSTTSSSRVSTSNSNTANHHAMQPYALDRRRRVFSAPHTNRDLMRLSMQKRFCKEAWYQKALKTMKELPAYRSQLGDDYSDDPEEIAKRLCRTTASSRAREAATGRVVILEKSEDKKNINQRSPRKTVTVDFVHVEDMMRFKGQKHVSGSEMQDIVRRLSECSPLRVPDAQRVTPRENIHRVGLMNTSFWRGENKFQKEEVNRINVENLIRQLNGP